MHSSHASPPQACIDASLLAGYYKYTSRDAEGCKGAQQLVPLRLAYTTTGENTGHNVSNGVADQQELMNCTSFVFMMD